MQTELVPYLEYIKQDYMNWSPRGTPIREKMIEEFCDKVRYEVGNKYIKVIAGSSVHSFIVRQDDGKFKAGDILKAASWRSPAKNFVRGNIFAKTFDRVRWTGVS